MMINHIKIPQKIKIVKAIVHDEEYVQYDFTMNDTIDDKHDSPFEPHDEESSGDVSDYVQAHLQRVNRGNKQWIPPPQVEVGDVKEIELTKDDIVFIQLTKFSANRIRACNWLKVQDIPYVSFKEGFIGVRAKDKAFYLRYSENFMRRLLSHIGVKDIENCQYHVTFLGNARDNDRVKYISKFQISHRDFIPQEMEKSGNNWYIFYTFETKWNDIKCAGFQTKPDFPV